MSQTTTRSLMGIAVAGLIVSLGSPLLAQSNMGTWVANVAKSTYSPDPAPKSSTLTTTETTFTKGGKVTSVNTSVVAADGKTMTITAKGTNAQGQPMLNVQLYEKK